MFKFIVMFLNFHKNLTEEQKSNGNLFKFNGDLNRNNKEKLNENSKQKLYSSKVNLYNNNKRKREDNIIKNANKDIFY
jgi:hypothetical protein